MKVTPRKLKGFQDYSPEVMRQRLSIIEQARKAASQAGFYEIATPALEYAEVLLGVGGETDKQVFRFMDGGERDVALRYDLTVPFARYASENFGKLSLPFKRLQIGDVWRAEKPQKGRFREFSQCDIDIIGVDSLSADAEILLTVLNILNPVIKAPFTISCNNRKILSFLIKKILHLHESEKEQEALILLDKFDKIGKDSLIQLFEETLSASKEKTGELLELLTAFNQDNPKSILQYFDNDDIKLEWKRFEQTIKIVQDLSSHDFGKVKINLSIARGLAYYTGIVFETTVDGVIGFGSICSGGRYNNLTERFVDHELAGVGISIGVDRLTALLMEKQDSSFKISADIYIAVAGEDNIPEAFKLALDLRREGFSVDLALKDQKLGSQFKHADKRGFNSVIVLGSDEVKNQTYTLKNMKTGIEKKELKWNELLNVLRS